MIGEEVYKKKKGALKKGIETSLWAANAHLFLNITLFFLAFILGLGPLLLFVLSSYNFH